MSMQEYLLRQSLRLEESPLALKGRKHDKNANDGENPRWSVWGFVSRLLTCLVPSRFIRRSNNPNDIQMEQAWREKVGLCMLIVLSCLALGFVTFGLSVFVCRPPGCIYKHADVKKNKANRWYIVHGLIYHIPEYFVEYYDNEDDRQKNPDPFQAFAGMDITVYFPYNPTCKKIGLNHEFVCEYPRSGYQECHSVDVLAKLHQLGQVKWEWWEIENNSRKLSYNGIVLDVGYYLDQVPKDGGDYPFGEKVDQILRDNVGGDATKAFTQLDRRMIRCLIEHFGAGTLDVKSVGCILTDVVLYVSLITILAVIFTKFILSALFTCIFSKRLCRVKKIKEDSGGTGQAEKMEAAKKTRLGSRYSIAMQRNSGSMESGILLLENVDDNAGKENMLAEPESDDLYTIMMVPCYSEDQDGLMGTITSLVETDYPDENKLLFVVADGIVQGSGNEKSTPEMLIEMMEIDREAGVVEGHVWSELANIRMDKDYGKTDGATQRYLTTMYGEKRRSIDDPNWLPTAYSYVAIADGKKRHNMARVFAGYYRSGDHCVPALVVVKCGTPEEAKLPKPGNRGKRDSQIILMSFLSKVLFNDRMTPLEYDMYIKIKHLMGISADQFETVLFVDADTRVRPNSLTYMVAAMQNDPHVMGLCGETQIANKSSSWVTCIQVFEYFISHYLNKAFESVFGGVTCLPGCFCMYRIKARKGPPGCWVPILGSPDIVDSYSENVTDTLHKKNLLLLGEDRYLTTLMLKTFPKRKMIFVPAAKCKTVVPEEFSVLLSQRRRWINSTVHNLFELVLVPDLCGIFCFSMQFVIFMELAGTLVLPAAIAFTGVLIVSSFVSHVEYIPLFLLLAILGLPAFLIFFAARSAKYFLYLICYLVSLPIWNFVLPVYAFWHFDDFSWGETRKIQNEDPNEIHGSKEGEFDSSKIFMRRWHEYEIEISKRIGDQWIAAPAG